MEATIVCNENFVDHESLHSILKIRSCKQEMDFTIVFIFVDKTQTKMEEF